MFTICSLMVRTLKDAWYAGRRIKVRCFVVGPHHKSAIARTSIAIRPQNSSEVASVDARQYPAGRTCAEDALSEVRQSKCEGVFEVPNSPQSVSIVTN